MPDRQLHVLGQAECAAGRPTYDSLGVCSTCEDITSRVVNQSEPFYEYAVPGNSDDEHTLIVNGSDWMPATWYNGVTDNIIGMVNSLHRPSESTQNSSAPATAYSCTVSLCVKTYHGEIINGELSGCVLKTRRCLPEHESPTRS
jgi:hypothetical protein